MIKRLVMLGLAVAAPAAFADSTLTGHVTDARGAPVEDASVYITGDVGLETVVKTDKHGTYRATVHHAGDYSIMFAFGSSKFVGKLTIADGAAASLDGVLGAGGEVIEIHDPLKPIVYPKVKSDPLVIPKYSDEAILTDKWAKAWLLLDVNERGDVTRLKFLKRPGLDLDETAIKHAFGLTFTPARNEEGKPVRSYVVWPIEWPSYWWLQARFGVMTHIPRWNGMVPFVHWPPCEGSGPLRLGSIHPVYRDCSKPDLSRADASERWLTAASVRAQKR